MDLVDITVWASKEIRTIEVTQNFLHAPYKVDVREFVPIEGDMLEERWTDGAIIKTHAIPPYGVVDMEKTAEDLWHFVDENVANYFVNWVGDKDPLLWHTYWMAYKHSEESDVNFTSFTTFPGPRADFDTGTRGEKDVAGLYAPLGRLPTHKLPGAHLRGGQARSEQRRRSYEPLVPSHSNTPRDGRST